MRNYIKQYHKRFVGEEEGMELLQFAMVVVVVVGVFVAVVYHGKVIKANVTKATQEAETQFNNALNNGNNP